MLAAAGQDALSFSYHHGVAILSECFERLGRGEEAIALLQDSLRSECCFERVGLLSHNRIGLHSLLRRTAWGFSSRLPRRRCIGTLAVLCPFTLHSRASHDTHAPAGWTPAVLVDAVPATVSRQ